MAIANLANTPNTPEELAAWSFSHMAQHRDENAAIYRIYGVVLPEFLLDPINIKDLGTFSNQHQLWHNDVAAVLGTQGFDLTNVNWEDPEQREAWIGINFQAHFDSSEKLRIG